MPRFGIIFIMSVLVSIGTLSVAAPQEPPLPSPSFQSLRLGKVSPAGWIKAQMGRDLSEGFAGHLDELAPEARSDIFASGRNTPEKPNLAATGGGEAAWWNGETEGNWRTGYIMMAYLSGDTEAQEKADAYVRHILKTQDPDGYIGVYGPSLRYYSNPLNGELWTQTCILRGLLAYYEMTGKPEVLDAVKHAVRCSMLKYGPGKMTAFELPDALGGVFHGLMFTDVLERLYDLTGNPDYRDFGVWMYKDYCAAASPYFSDMTVASLLNLGKPWTDHGVHTYEHIRALLWAYYATGDPELHQAYRNALTKLHRYELPSGAAVSMENIDARRPDPTETYYEYCALKELLASLVSGLQKTGAGELGDSVEKILFNAAEGARASHGKEIAYCTRDNRYAVDGAVLGRDKFSPAHSDIAVCCNPNATQIFPLYVRGMWMRTPDGGLAALLYGPSSVETLVKDVEVRVDEHTDYPFSSVISMVISPQQPVEFSILLRNPGWSKRTNVACQGATVSGRGDYFVVHKRWTKGDRLKIEFNEPVVEIPASNGEVYFQRGPLVYALAIPAKAVEIKKYKLDGFADLAYFPVVGADWSYAFDPGVGKTDRGFTFQSASDADLLHPFDGAPVRLQGSLINLNTGKAEGVSLIPMGSSLAMLRRITFPLRSTTPTLR